ncbi:MAG TPA: hypothetical protein VGR02_07095 [Thermoanaerobaculia bacterium]|jgi:hypothetical protein|nr:hypothetical protein [Thermoanaerobaculia bacterium]
MSRRANIIEILFAALLLACGSAAPRPAAARESLARIQHCLGDVVPLCTSVLILSDGRLEYERPGQRTLSRQLGKQEMDDLRREIASLDLAAPRAKEDPIGPFVVIQLSKAAWTFAPADLPSETVPLLRSVDRVAQAAFGRVYRPILDSRRTILPPPASHR